jgi:hypothetical protein
MRLISRRFRLPRHQLFAGLLALGVIGAAVELGACGSFGSAPLPGSDASAQSPVDASGADGQVEPSLDGGPSDDAQVLPDGAVVCSTVLPAIDEKFGTRGVSLFDAVATLGGASGDEVYLAGTEACGDGGAERLAIYRMELSGVTTRVACFNEPSERATAIAADRGGLVVGANVQVTGGSEGRIHRLNFNGSNRAAAVPISFANRTVSVTSVQRVQGADVWAYASIGANDARGYMATVDGGRLLDLGARAAPAIVTWTQAVATVDVALGSGGQTVAVTRYNPAPDGSLAPDANFGTNGVQTITAPGADVSGFTGASAAMLGSVVALGMPASSGAAVRILEGKKPSRSVTIPEASGKTSVVFDCDGSILAATGSSTAKVVRIGPGATAIEGMFEIAGDRPSVALLRAGGDTFWVRSSDKGTDVVRLQRKVL